MHKLFEGLGDFLSQRLKEFGPEVAAEAGRMGTQGAMEAANALFNGSAFVPYGPGQYTPTPEIEKTGLEHGMEGLQNDGIER